MVGFLILNLYSSVKNHKLYYFRDSNFSRKMEINRILHQMGGIDLSEMDSVSLLQRMDTKFVVPFASLEKMLLSVADKYRSLEINNQRLATYETHYYDTEDFALYKAHHNGKLNRYKIRHREYVESDLSFLEVKFKNNKGKTIKTRINSSFNDEGFHTSELEFIDSLMNHVPAKGLKKVLTNTFKRATLVSIENRERLTIDTQLSFFHNNQLIELPHLAIIEVKNDKSSGNSEFLKLMREMHISPYSFSKYCTGVTMLYPDIKRNNFKVRLLFINKLRKYGLESTKSIR